MTFVGFIIMAVIVFAIFYAWYWFAHRDGVYNATTGKEPDTPAPTTERRRANPRPRPTPPRALLAETGTIGDPEDHVEGARLSADVTAPAFLGTGGDVVRDDALDALDAVGPVQDVSIPPAASLYVNGTVGDVDSVSAVQSPTRLLPAPTPDFLNETGSIGDINPGVTNTLAGDAPQNGVFPPPDVEFAPLPTAEYQNLGNQLPLADDTVKFKEPAQK